MNILSQLLEGKKTYISLVFVFLGAVGFSNYISENETSILIDNIIQIGGIIFAIYGRIVAKPK